VAPAGWQGAPARLIEIRVRRAGGARMTFVRLVSAPLLRGRLLLADRPSPERLAAAVAGVLEAPHTRRRLDATALERQTTGGVMIAPSAQVACQPAAVCRGGCTRNRPICKVAAAGVANTSSRELRSATWRELKHSAPMLRRRMLRPPLLSARTELGAGRRRRRGISLGAILSNPLRRLDANDLIYGDESLKSAPNRDWFYGRATLGRPANPSSSASTATSGGGARHARAEVAKKFMDIDRWGRPAWEGRWPELSRVGSTRAAERRKN
jgi:hypothetical protein